MNQRDRKLGVEERLGALESNLFQLMLFLTAGGFVVVGGLLGIIATLLAALLAP